ncbi:transcription elongation factor Elf1 like-domain-containing protein, partial [Syncephalis plumigaleata]
MGKRKSARKPVAKVRQRLDKQFSCIFCNHEKSIEVKLDKESKVGNVMCRVCSANWQTSINYLSEPVDVYSEWIDACEAAQQEDARANYDEDDRDRSDYGRSTNSRGYNDNDEDD